LATSVASCLSFQSHCIGWTSQGVPDANLGSTWEQALKGATTAHVMQAVTQRPHLDTKATVAEGTNKQPQSLQPRKRFQPPQGEAIHIGAVVNALNEERGVWRTGIVRNVSNGFYTVEWDVQDKKASKEAVVHRDFVERLPSFKMNDMVYAYSTKRQRWRPGQVTDLHVRSGLWQVTWRNGRQSLFYEKDIRRAATQHGWWFAPLRGRPWVGERVQAPCYIAEFDEYAWYDALVRWKYKGKEEVRVRWLSPELKNGTAVVPIHEIRRRERRRIKRSTRVLRRQHLNRRYVGIVQESRLGRAIIDFGAHTTGVLAVTGGHTFVKDDIVEVVVVQVNDELSSQFVLELVARQCRTHPNAL